MESTEGIVYSVIIGSLLILVLILTLIVFVVAYTRKIEQKNSAIHLAEKSKQLEIVKAVLETQEAEREKISNNLHDEIGPLMTALKNDLSMMRYDLEEGVLTQNTIIKSQGFLKEIIESIRSVSHDLSPQFVMKYGLSRGITQFLSHLVFTEKIVDIELNDRDFSKLTKINIYRVVLELVNNLMKHERFSYLKVLGNSLEDGMVEIMISHNGKGLTQEQFDYLKQESDGMGLGSIASRLLVLNGRISHYHSNNKAHIKLTIPTKSNEKVD